jgi:hypothetical protein
MRRIPTIAFLVACAVGAARAQTYHACLEYNANYYDLTSTRRARRWTGTREQRS